MQYTCPHCGRDSEINPAALLGSTTSKRKARAARRNAKLGGWPKGRKRGKRVGPAFAVGASNATGPTRKSKDSNVIVSRRVPVSAFGLYLPSALPSP